MFKTQLTINNFMKEGSLCPKCKKGHMHFQGNSGSDSNSQQTANRSKRALECDNCKYKYIQIPM